MMQDSVDPPSDLGAFRDALCEWYDEHHREFPWRDTTDPYAILVSEIMSHQTQLDRVETAWRAFLDRWPTVDALATADQADVVAFWSTQRLGYNNRARYLHRTAQQVVDEFDGTIPESPTDLESLPGVGPYTANAVASFAYNNGEAVVDTNVKRVLYRVFSDLHEQDSPTYQQIADALMPAGDSRIWNNAVMELGALACEKTPRCDAADCPWRAWCDAYASGDFTAPDVPIQPEFEGSRRQYRGRVIRALRDDAELALDDLGPRIRVDYVPDGEYGRDWLRDLLEDLENDGLVELRPREDGVSVRLQE